jgi:Flp pilus assembly pilin Flp
LSCGAIFQEMREETIGKVLSDFLRSEDGTSAIGYAIIASLMALVLAAAPALGAKVRGLHTSVAAKMPLREGRTVLSGRKMP